MCIGGDDACSFPVVWDNSYFVWINPHLVLKAPSLLDHFEQMLLERFDSFGVKSKIEV